MIEIRAVKEGKSLFQYDGNRAVSVKSVARRGSDAQLVCRQNMALETAGLGFRARKFRPIFRNGFSVDVNVLDKVQRSA